jgi:peptide/nickel transport system substrate-binding protein
MSLRRLQWLAAAYLKRHRVLSLGLALVLLLSIYFIRSNPVQPIWGWVQNSILNTRFSEGMVGTPQTLNPLFASSDSERDLSRILFRGLTKTDLSGQTSGDLAESWDVSSSGQVYLFHLREGLKFSNGDPLTIEDVIFTYELAKNPEAGSVYADTFQNLEIQAVSENSVLFRLPDPFSPFLSLTDLGILPKKILEKIPPQELKFHKYNLSPVGSSSFRVKAIDKEGAVLTQGDKEYAFKFYQDIEDLKTALKMGEVKAAGFTEPVNFDGWQNLQVLSSPLYQRFSGIFYNLRGGVTAERGVRQGLSYAVEKNKIMTDVLDGTVTPAETPISAASWAKTEELRHYDFDLERSKLTLDRAGWVGSPIRSKAGKELEVTISFREGSISQKIAEEVARDWARVGVKAILNPLSPNDFRTKVIANKDFQAAIFTQEAGVDPDQYVLWHTTQADSANITGLKLPKLDKALEDARREVDITKRKQLYADFQRFFLEEVPATLLFQPNYTFVVSTKIDGIELRPLGLPSDRYNEISSWKVEEKLF